MPFDVRVKERYLDSWYAGGFLARRRGTAFRLVACPQPFEVVRGNGIWTRGRSNMPRVQIPFLCRAQAALAAATSPYTVPK